MQDIQGPVFDPVSFVPGEYFVPIRISLGSIVNGTMQDFMLWDLGPKAGMPLPEEIATITAADLGLSPVYAHEIAGQIRTEIQMLAPAVAQQARIYAMWRDNSVVQPSVHRFELDLWRDGQRLRDTILWDVHVRQPYSTALLVARSIVDDVGLAVTLESGMRWEGAIARAILRYHYQVLLALGCGLPDCAVITYRSALSHLEAAPLRASGLLPETNDAEFKESAEVAAELLAQQAEGNTGRGARRQRTVIAKNEIYIREPLQPSLLNTAEEVALLSGVQLDGNGLVETTCKAAAAAAE